jgi:hypothetical protein
MDWYREYRRNGGVVSPPMKITNGGGCDLDAITERWLKVNECHQREAQEEESMRDTIFLGGTAANNYWRTAFTAELIREGVPVASIFNPVVVDWNAEAQAREEDAKRRAAVHVYYIADPKQEGNPLSAYSMVEATMALYDRPEDTVVVFDSSGVSGHPLKAMNQTAFVLRERFLLAHILIDPAMAPSTVAACWRAKRIDHDQQQRKG